MSNFFQLFIAWGVLLLVLLSLYLIDKVNTIYRNPVSYTHLTLPTILLV